MTAPLLIERREGVTTLTLNQPNRANVLSTDLCDALISALKDLSADRDLRAVLITANGKQFCGGGDLDMSVNSGDRIPQVLGDVITALNEMIMSLVSLPVPVVTALNGPVSGGGIGLAWSADIVIAADSMRLVGGYSAIGVTPDVGCSWFLPRILGPMRTKQLLFGNVSWDAKECLDFGLLTQVVPDAQLQEAASALACALARGASGSLARIKSLVNGAMERSLQDQLILERIYMVESVGSADAAEGVSAFMERRAPRFGARTPE